MRGIWPAVASLWLCLFAIGCSEGASVRDAGLDAGLDAGDGGDEGLPVCQGSIELREIPEEIDTTFPVGPIVDLADRDHATIMWEPETVCEDGELVYGPSADSLDLRVAASRDDRILKARLIGLETDTRYFYRVSACGLESSVLSFYTAPPPSTPIRFAIWGDSQSHPEISGPLVEQFKRDRPHMTLHVGDVLGDGTVYDQWRDEHFTPLRPIGHYLPTHSAMGNHERNALAYYRYFDNPIPEALRDPDQWGANYALRYGNVFFLVLDTNNLHLLAAELVPDSAVVEWVEAQLRSEQARTATWRIAAAHHPALAECWSPGNCDGFAGQGMVEEWLFPRLAEHGFHAYFCGHTHAYERGEIDGVLHLISGGAGGNLDEWCRDFEEIEIVENAHHYVRVDAACDRMTLRAYRAGESEPFDEVVIEHGAP
ncbi:MAG: metallophosphoesterase family protein [Deltaproteobacteria bacterium]|nr:metallophosphoesterase family protein [Deltaproteobacteria bacterium]